MIVLFEQFQNLIITSLNKIMKTSRLKLKDPETFRSINMSPTNRSKSKHTFSFSKSARFANNDSVCPQATYNGDYMNTKYKGAAIGYGRKSDFTKVLTVSPGSSKYHLKTALETAVQKKKGYQMGAGRDKIVYRSYVDRELCKTPSADRYNLTLQTKKKSPIFSLRSRTKIQNKSMTIEAQNSNPGPGQYENNPEANALQSRYSLGKFATLSYGTSRSHRFGNSDNKIPGPATYADVSNLSSVGRYIVSSHRGGTKAKFDKSRRITKFDTAARKSKQNPGPGSYRAPSEFGQYDGNIYATINV